MLTPFVLVVGLLLATAFIAYWSDNLGKKLGKKRVTFWKLRPRDTATLFTVASSEVIMLVTLMVLLVIYRPLRNALTKYDYVRAENNRLQDANGQLQSERSELEADANQSEIYLTAERRQVVVAVHDLHLTQGKLVSSRQDLTRVSATLIQTQQGELEARHQQTAAKKGEIAAEVLATAARADLVAAQNGLHDVEVKYAEAAEELKSRLNALETAQAQLQTTRAQLGKLKLQLTSARNDLAATQTNFEQAQGKYNSARMAAFAASRAALAAGQQQLEAESKAAAAEEAARTANNDALTAETLLAFHDIRVPLNQVLVARTLPAHSTEAEARATLTDLVSEGQTVLPTLLEGAELNLLPISTGSSPTPIPVESDGPMIGELASVVAGQNEDISLRLIAARNYLKDEKALDARIGGVVARRAYKEGDTIAETQLDGSATDATVFSGLNRLLDLGRQQAVMQNVNPPLSPALPNFYSSGTSERMFEALRNLEALKRPATVKLVAAADLTTVDPLNVRFEVE